MTRKEERELAFTLIFEKIFNDDLTVEEIIKNVQRMKIIIRDKKSAHYMRQLTDFEIIKKPITCFSLPTDIDEKVDYSKLKKSRTRKG